MGDVLFWYCPRSDVEEDGIERTKYHADERNLHISTELDCCGSDQNECTHRNCVFKHARHEPDRELKPRNE